MTSDPACRSIATTSQRWSGASRGRARLSGTSRARSADDARRVELALSAAGRRMVGKGKAGQTAQERLAEALERLPAKQRRALAESLEAWLAEAQLSGTPATMVFEQR